MKVCVLFAQIGHVDRDIHSLVPTMLGKNEKAAEEALQLVLVAGGGVLGKDNDVVALLEGCDAFAKGAEKTRITVCRDEAKPFVKKACQRAGNKAEEAGKMEIPVLLLMIVDPRLVLVALDKTGVHLVGTPHSDGLVAVKLKRKGSIGAYMVADDDAAVSELFAKIDEAGLFIAAQK